jgi:hypothetical protein
MKIRIGEQRETDLLHGGKVIHWNTGYLCWEHPVFGGHYSWSPNLFDWQAFSGPTGDALTWLVWCDEN